MNLLLEPGWLVFAASVTAKASLLLLAALAVTWLMRGASAAARHLGWSVALAGVLLLPLLTVVVPPVAVPVLPAAAERIDHPPSQVDRQASAGGPLLDVPIVSSGSPTATGTRTGEPLPEGGGLLPDLAGHQWILLLWAAGAAVIGLRLLLGLLQIGWLARRATMVTDGSWLQLAHTLAQRLGIARAVTLLRGSAGAVPMTWGFLQPVVWLPADADGWTDERRRAVLAHELAHVRRGDALTQWIGHLALALHWFNPLVWLAVRRLRAERERACDDAVIALGMGPAEYAGHLLDMVRSLGTEDGSMPAMAMARRSQFEGRLLAILDPKVSRRALGGLWTGGWMLAALCAAAPLAALSPTFRAVAAEPVASTSRHALPEGSAREPYASARGEAEREKAAAPHAGSAAPVLAPELLALARSLLPQGVDATLMTRAATSPGDSLVREIIRASETIHSGSDRRRLLLIVLETVSLGDAAQRELLGAVGSLPSSSGQSAVLLDFVSRYGAGPGDGFFAVVEALPSSSDQRRVLTAVLARDDLSHRTRQLLLRTTANLASSSHRAEVLTAFTARHTLEESPAFFTAVDGLPSSSDRERVLLAVASRSGISEAVVRGALASAAQIPSSGARTRVLIALAGVVTPGARDAYLEAAGTISSTSDRQRVLTALLAPEAARTSTVPPPAHRSGGVESTTELNHKDTAPDGTVVRTNLSVRDVVRTNAPREGGRWTLATHRPGRDASAAPDVTFELLPGGFLLVEQVRGASVRTVELRPASAGNLGREHRIDGRSVPFDAGAEALLQTGLEILQRQTRPVIRR
jgi:beta-lactamase regulating signal transducer with metallopeptidase domain